MQFSLKTDLLSFTKFRPKCGGALTRVNTVVQAVTARPDLCDVIGSVAVTTLTCAAAVAAADATAADSQTNSV